MSPTSAPSLIASPLTFRDELVSDLRKKLSSGDFALRDVPQVIQLIIRDEMWRERMIRATGQVQRFERFIDFVTTDPLEGLGTDVKTLQRLCSDNPEALDLLDQALSSRQGERTDLVSNVHKVDRPAGNASAAALRKLRKHRPDLHALVLAGKLSPHAAMVQAGFRVKTATIPIDSDKTVDMLARHFDPEKLEAAAVKARARLEGKIE